MKLFHGNIGILMLVFSILFSFNSPKPAGPFLATGIKIGEVTQNSAIVWVRLTETPKRIGNNAPMPDIKYKNPETGELVDRSGRPDMEPIVSYPTGYTLNTIQGATPGSEGKARVKYRKKGEQNWIQLGWQTVDPNAACSTQFKLSNLSEGSEYEILAEASPLRGKKVSASLDGKLKTAPNKNSEEEINFIVTTCTSYPDVDSETGYKLYPSSLRLHPEFFVHTGDIVYYDGMGKTADLARWHWDRMYSLQNHIDFHKQVASYFMKDDHDTWMNDAYPGMKTNFMGEFTYEQGTQIFLDEVPMGDKTYRTFRWGRHLQIWMVEGRDYRSPNPIPDGPNKTIWGKEQMDWFKSTVKESDATFKVLLTPTPIVGPDRQNKKDNYANKGFQYEGKLLMEFMSEQKMISITGDRHWQYVSKDAETGLLEFGCGPGSDAHAGGWKQEDKLPEHIYLNVVGGFLEVCVTHAEGVPTLIFRHYNPDGKILNEYVYET